MHKPWTITAKAGGELEILLYEQIGASFWDEGTTAKSFAEDLKDAGPVSKIHLRVNSPGGNVFDGIAIYNTLLSHGAKITAQVDGLAASIASVIIMAASEISMGDNAMMMIHNPSTMIAGDSNDMRKMADTMDKVKTSMITAYRRHSRKSTDQIGTLMDAETWMTAQETVDNGFAEKVITPEGEDADVAANFGQMFACFRKVPQQIAARFSGSTSRTKRVDGENLTSDCFLYVGDEEKTDTWHLPWKFSSEEKTVSHLRDALARFDQTDIPESEKAAVRAKLVKLCKEHGIAVSDAKSGKAMAKLLAAGKRKTEDSDSSCGCACAPCSEENDCQDCVNADCEDGDCRQNDCPMQAKTTAALKKQLARANRAIETLKTDLAAAQTEKSGIAGEREKDSAATSRWMQRFSGELEQASKLAASALENLPKERAASEALIARLTASLESAGSALLAEKKSHAEDAAAHAQWVERSVGELRRAASLYAVATEEFPRLLRASEARIASLQAELETAQNAFAGEKKLRAEEAGNHAQWATRLRADLQKAQTAYTAVLAELPRIAAEADSRVAAIAAELETAQTALSAEKQARVGEAQANLQLFSRLSATLKQASALYSEASEELPRRSRATESSAELIQASLASIRTATEAGKKSRAAQSGTVAGIEGPASSMQAAVDLGAAALEELPRRIRAAETSAIQMQSDMAGAQAQAEARRQVRGEEAETQRKSAERIQAQLEEASGLSAAALEDLPRRARAAETRADQLKAAVAESGAASDSLKNTREEAAKSAAAVERIHGDLQKAAAIYASAAEEISRRVRLTQL